MIVFSMLAHFTLLVEYFRKVSDNFVHLIQRIDGGDRKVHFNKVTRMKCCKAINQCFTEFKIALFLLLVDVCM